MQERERERRTLKKDAIAQSRSGNAWMQLTAGLACPRTFNP
jgi:hypothetical protein